MPCCARRVVSVAPIIAKVKPEETPRNSAASGARSRYGLRLLTAPLAQLVLIVDGERSVVGEALRLVDRLLLRGARHAGRGDLVVDAPADVLLPRLAAVRPPGVLLGPGIQPAEHVDEAELVEDARQPRALLRQEARVLAVRAPVLQVDLVVGDVPVAAQDDLVSSFPDLFQVNDESLEEAEFRCLAVRPGGAGGQVKGDDPELAEARLDVAALVVELAHREAAPHFVGRAPAVERDAAVALLLRERMTGLERLQAVQLGIEIALVAFQFLQADDVGTLRLQPAKRTLARGAPNAVDVERDDPDGKLETPPCAADHLAGSCRNFSTSEICAAWR